MGPWGQWVDGQVLEVLTDKARFPYFLPQTQKPFNPSGLLSFPSLDPYPAFRRMLSPDLRAEKAEAC